MPSARTAMPSSRGREIVARTMAASPGIDSEMVDESLCYLDMTARESAQVIERRVAGAKIVNGDSETVSCIVSRDLAGLALQYFARCCLHLVVACVFGMVERRIGAGKEVCGRLACHPARHAKADRNLTKTIGRLKFRNFLPDAIRYADCLLFRGSWQQKDKLVASVSRGQIIDPQLTREDCGHAPKHLVTGDVPELIVDRFEIVEVRKNHAEIPVHA